MNIIVFNTENEAIAFEKFIWTTLVKKYVNEGQIVVDNQGNKIEDVTDWADADISALNISGYVEGTIQTDSGLTKKFGNPEEAYNAGLWYLPVPRNGLTNIVDLTGQDIRELPLEWIPPEL